ncbi:leucine-rich repeat-containing protein 74A isoform X3 [Vanacampus margaritifer]
MLLFSSLRLRVRCSSPHSEVFQVQIPQLTQMSTLSFESLSLEDDDQATLRQGLDEDFDTDLHECCLTHDAHNKTEKEDRSNKASVADVYLQACKLVGVVPVSYFIRNLDSPTMTLSHYGLGPLGCKALAIALVSEMHISTLELADNHIQAEGAKDLAEMLKANFTIQHLDLSSNHLQSSGAEHVGKMLLDSLSLKSIKLSGNGFTDNDAKYFAEALSINFSIKELDLSHNTFCGRGGEYLGLLLANNEHLEVLNLSWNQLRMKGAVALSAGLKVNTMLKHLDLSWNGFGNEGALAMGEALKFNNTLVHLNLNNNRITNEGVSMFCRGLEYNDTLRVLMLAYNSLTVEGALSLVNMVKKTPKTALEEINICNVLVNENFLHLLEVTCDEHPGLDVQYGGVGGFIAKKPLKRIDPMKVIQDYLDQRKLRLWDFFRNIDKDATMRVPVVDFRNAIQQSSVPLDRFQIEELVQRLDRDGTGMVDYRGLVDTRKQMMQNHRRQLRKVASRQKKEKHKSDRILKTFQSAVEAVTPHGSVVISPGDTKADSAGPNRFSATPLSSWHHIVMSNSAAVSNPSDHVHLPILAGATPHRFTKSPNLHSCSQPDLLTTSPHSTQGRFMPTRAVRSSPEMGHIKFKQPTINHLTRSRPALDTTQLEVKAKKVKKSKAKKLMEKYSKNPKTLQKYN